MTSKELAEQLIALAEELTKKDEQVFDAFGDGFLVGTGDALRSYLEKPFADAAAARGIEVDSTEGVEAWNNFVAGIAEGLTSTV